MAGERRAFGCTKRPDDSLGPRNAVALNPLRRELARLPLSLRRRSCAYPPAVVAFAYAGSANP